MGCNITPDMRCASLVCMLCVWQWVVINTRYVEVHLLFACFAPDNGLEHNTRYVEVHLCLHARHGVCHRLYCMLNMLDIACLTWGVS